MYLVLQWGGHEIHNFHCSALPYNISYLVFFIATPSLTLRNITRTVICVNLVCKILCVRNFHVTIFSSISSTCHIHVS